MKPDSGYAWLVLVAAHITNFVSIGFLYAVIGLLIPEYNKHFNVETTQSSWVGSVLTGFLLLGGPFAALIITKLSCRTVAIAAMIVHLAGLIISAFVTKIWHVIIIFAVFSGFAGSCLHVVTLEMLTLYFAKRQHMAYAIAFSGCDVAGISFPFIARYILDTLQYNYSILSLAAIISIGLPCAFVFIQPNFNEDNQNAEVELKDLASEPSEPVSPVEPTTENGHIDPEASNLLSSVSNNNNISEPSKMNHTEPENSVSVKQISCCDPKELISMLTILKKPVIVVFLINAFLFNVSGGIMSVLAYDFYEKSEFNATDASVGYTFYGIGSLLGSVLLALIAVFLKTNGLLVHIVSNAVLAITQIVFPFLNFNHWLLSLLLAAFGFGYGLICANLGSMIDHINGDYMLSMVYGFEMAAAGIGNFIGPVVAANIQSAFGEKMGFVFGSCCSFLALGILVVFCLYHRDIYIPLNSRGDNSENRK